MCNRQCQFRPNLAHNVIPDGAFYGNFSLVTRHKVRPFLSLQACIASSDVTSAQRILVLREAQKIRMQ